MIAHVAEAGEARGRVVLHLSSSRPSPVALEAAICVAQAFQSEIESLFVENEQVFELAGFSFAREISASGRRSRSLSLADLEQESRLVSTAVQRQIEKLARAAEVPIRQRTVRDETVNALASACAERGPWNVIVLAEPFGVTGSPLLRQLLESIAGTTGLILVGPRARRTSGSVIAAVEDIERLPGMLRAADRLTTVAGGDVVVLLVSEDAERLRWLEAQARLLLGDATNARIAVAEVGPNASAVAAEVLRRLRAGFVIGRLGGLVVPDEHEMQPLAAALECPLFLVR